MRQARERALEEAQKHAHLKGEKGKCKICGKEMEKIDNEEDEEGKELNDKGHYPKKEFGAKNNDSQED